MDGQTDRNRHVNCPDFGLIDPLSRPWRECPNRGHSQLYSRFWTFQIGPLLRKIWPKNWSKFVFQRYSKSPPKVCDQYLYIYSLTRLTMVPKGIQFRVAYKCDHAFSHITDFPETTTRKCPSEHWWLLGYYFNFVLQSLDAQLLIFILKLFGFSAETVTSSSEFHGAIIRCSREEISGYFQSASVLKIFCEWPLRWVVSKSLKNVFDGVL